MEEQKYLTTDDVVRMYGINREMLYQLTHKKKIRHYKVLGGKKLFFLPKDIDELFKNGEVVAEPIRIVEVK